MLPCSIEDVLQEAFPHPTEKKEQLRNEIRQLFNQQFQNGLNEGRRLQQAPGQQQQQGYDGTMSNETAELIEAAKEEGRQETQTDVKREVRERLNDYTKEEIQNMSVTFDQGLHAAQYLQSVGK